MTYYRGRKSLGLVVAKLQIVAFTIGTSGRLLTHESAIGQKGEIIANRSLLIITESAVIILLYPSTALPLGKVLTIYSTAVSVFVDNAC
jgi:hypothetical protein